MFSVEQVITENYPALNNNRLFAPIVKLILRHLLHEQAFVDFAEQYPHLRGIEFVEQVLDYFSFTFAVSEREQENILASGKVVIPREIKFISGGAVIFHHTRMLEVNSGLDDDLFDPHLEPGALAESNPPARVGH